MKHPDPLHHQQYFYKPASSQSKVDRVRVVQRNNVCQRTVDALNSSMAFIIQSLARVRVIKKKERNLTCNFADEINLIYLSSGVFFKAKIKCMTSNLIKKRSTLYVFLCEGILYSLHLIQIHRALNLEYGENLTAL